MTSASYAINENYWENFLLSQEDIEFIYNHLLEIETPLTTQELVVVLVAERIGREKQAIEERRTSGGDLYQPKGSYKKDQYLVFPAIDWQRGKVVAVRNGYNPDMGEFRVIQVQLENGDQREFAGNLGEHKLNTPPKFTDNNPLLEAPYVLKHFSDELNQSVEEDLGTNPDFVRIAGKWFPRTLLVDINVGHLNIAEAVLEVAGGGPLSTSDLLEQVGIDSNVNKNLMEFSFDLALQEDERFDEVGPAGDVLWFLNRLEPPAVLEPPIFLRYSGIEYDRSLLTPEMLELERTLDDELSPVSGKFQHLDEATIHLIYPHWRAGTLPLSASIRHLFPTAYEAPRIQFTLVDGNSGKRFPAWVVREKRYVYGLKDWYEDNGLIPGSLLTVKRGKSPGEVIIKSESRRSVREWIRTILVGSDGGIVFAMLKQLVSGPFDERMAIAVPDPDSLDQIWEHMHKEQPAFEQVVVNIVRELSKLNPQGHVHFSELYAAINITRRCPPGPIMALLASRPWFMHVGDMHFRYNDLDI